MGVKFEYQRGIGHLVLDDPPLNILTQDLMRGVRQALGELAGERELRVLLVRAEGKHFSAGASVEEHLPDRVDAMIPEFMETVRALHEFPLPVVAAVQGRCLGGAFELVLAADLIVAGEGAQMGVPEIQLGVFPPAAALQLPALCSPQFAAELIYTGEPKPAAALRDAGLVRHVVPDDELATESLALAERIARHSGAALRSAKQALLLATRQPYGAADDVVSIYIGQLMATSDALEGLSSFMEKRRPEWSHQ